MYNIHAFSKWTDCLHSFKTEMLLYSLVLLLLFSRGSTAAGSTLCILCRGLMSHNFLHPGCTDGEVRLAGGLTPYYGRVELCQNGVWGTVCGGGITDNHIAEIVCKNLNIEYHGSFCAKHHETWSLLKYYFLDAKLLLDYGGGTGPIVWDKVKCKGHEDVLTDCASEAIHDCDHSQDIGVICGKYIIVTGVCT